MRDEVGADLEAAFGESSVMRPNQIAPSVPLLAADVMGTSRWWSLKAELPTSSGYYLRRDAQSGVFCQSMSSPRLQIST